MIFSQLESKQTEVWGMHQQGGPRHKKSAFSLLELLVVVAVIGLMMALLVPAVAGFIDSTGEIGAVPEPEAIITATVLLAGIGIYWLRRRRASQTGGQVWQEK